MARAAPGEESDSPEARIRRGRAGREKAVILRTVAGWNLLTRLLVLALAATIPAVAMLVVLQVQLRSDRTGRIAEEAMRQAELLNGGLANVVEGARQVGVAVSYLDSVRRLDPSCRERLRELRAAMPAYPLLAVLAADGAPVCSSADPPGATPPAYQLDLVQSALRNGEFDTGRYVAPGGGLGAMLPFGLPFTAADGERRGVVVIGLGLDWLARQIAGIKHPDGSTVDITDRDGRFLVRLPEVEMIGRPAPPALAAMLPLSTRGIRTVQGPDGKETLVAYIPTNEPPYDLFVSTGLLLPALLADIDRATYGGYALILTGALLSIGLALLVGERFVRRPTAALIAAAQAWAAGDLQARAGLAEPPQSEFGRLAAAFNAMAEALGRQRQELQELNATLEARVEARTRDLVDSRNRLQVEMAEREKSEASLRQAQKLQAVGQLAGGIAHEFNNVLTTVLGALELLRRRLPSGPDGLGKLVDSALYAAGRGTRLTGQLLTFARRQRLLPVPTDLNVTVAALSGLLASTLGRSIRIHTDLAQDLGPAMVDPNQLEAAILNLAINARDAMPGGGTLSISTRNLTVAADAPLPPGHYVVVRVSDTGTGMAPDVLARAIEPFFTAKEPGRGSGLGLSQVHGLAEQSGGELRIDSAPGQGTTVTLVLPRASAMPAVPLREAGLRGGARRRLRVLLVDDDDDVRLMTGEMLGELGCAVTTAADGAEALRLLETEAAFDVLLADYAMPGLDGIALIRAAQQRCPGLRALLATGYAEFAATDAAALEDIIRKPFTLVQLADRIDRLMMPLPSGAEAANDLVVPIRGRMR